MVSEIRHAIRALRRHPAFTAVAIVTLALGIRANAALFSNADLRRGNVGAGAPGHDDRPRPGAAHRGVTAFR